MNVSVGDHVHQPNYGSRNSAIRSGTAACRRRVWLLLWTLLASMVVLPGLQARTAPVAQAQEQATAGDLIALAGGTREATAALAAAYAYPDGADVVYLTRADDYPDALAAAALSDGPVLLVNRTGAGPDVLAAVARLNPQQVVVLGGEAALPASTVQPVAGSRPVVRVAGPDRYTTAALIAQRAFPSGVQRAYLVQGTGFADALSAGGLTDGPLLLVPPTGPAPRVVTDELDRLDISEIVVIGGPAAVSDATAADAAAGISTRRVWGADRYRTAVAVAELVGPADSAVLVSGAGFADGLAAGSLDAGPVLLVPQCGTVPEPVRTTLSAAPLSTLVVLGGRAALCDAVVAAAAAAANVVAPTIPIDEPGEDVDAPGDLIRKDLCPGEPVFDTAPWPNGEIVYSYLTATTDYPEWQSQIEAAMRTWEAAVGVRFVHRSASNRASDIVIGFFTGAHEPRVTSGYQHSAFGRGTLAHAALGSNYHGADSPVYVHFNDFYWFTDLVRYPGDAARGAHDLQSIALHEFGHTLGIRHTPASTGDVMYCDLAGKKVFRGLSSNDTALGRALYPTLQQRSEPLPAAHLTLAQGAANGAASWYSVRASGFPANTQLTLVCHDSVDPQGYYSETLTTDGAGTAADDTLCYSADGPDHWVTGGGVESNHVTWSGGGGGGGAASIALSQGGAAPAGSWYAVTLVGFAPGSQVTLTCRDSVDPGGFFTQTFTISTAGTAADDTLCYSADGPDHWVTGGGVESNHVTWSGGGGGGGAASIALSQGGAAPAGSWYAVTLVGFAPGSQVTLTCRDSVDPGGFFTQTFTISTAGTAADDTLCYSADGPDHWVTGGGVESNHVRW